MAEAARNLNLIALNHISSLKIILWGEFECWSIHRSDLPNKLIIVLYSSSFKGGYLDIKVFSFVWVVFFCPIKGAVIPGVDRTNCNNLRDTVGRLSNGDLFSS